MSTTTTAATTTAPTTGLQSRHQALLDQGQFTIQHCLGCNKFVYFPRSVCPHCGHGELALVPPKGAGQVFAVTTIRRKPDAGGNYNLSLIELDEGVRLMSRVEGVAPEQVKVGQRVQARVAQSDGRGLVVFDLVNGGA